ncbi:MAG: YitT family protein [Desulfobulbus sp.]|jgi:uncharacterized membrane-anchored protein YitT (DUF2179 family)
MRFRHLANTVWWNLLLLTCGSLIYAAGINGAVIQHTFITGGAFGAGLLIYYQTHLLSPPIWYLLINIPLFLAGWYFVGRRFFWYSLYGVAVVTLATQVLELNFNIHNQLYAAVAGGIVCGTGVGITLRSLGSTGGLDIVAVALHNRFNIGVGKVSLLFNVLLFLLAASLHSPDILIASIILVFISSTMVEYVVSMFNQRKILYVISEHTPEISRIFNQELKQGATFIKAKGAYTGKDRLILMAIANNLQVKKLENIVFSIDPEALFIVEKSFNVIGPNFGDRKQY